MHMGVQDSGVCQLHAISEDGISSGFGISSGTVAMWIYTEIFLLSLISETLRFSQRQGLRFTPCLYMHVCKVQVHFEVCPQTTDSDVFSHLKMTYCLHSHLSLSIQGDIYSIGLL